jgi:PAS domain S-box-containing protein
MPKIPLSSSNSYSQEEPFDCVALLTALPWGVLALDGQRMIQYMNPTMACWCGCPPENLSGQPLTGAPLPPALRTALLQLLALDAAVPQEVFLPQMEQWISLAATRPAEGWLVYAQDITERRQHEALLQAREERQTFLLQLSDVLRALTDAGEIQITAARVLGERLGSDRVCYVELKPASQEMIVARDWHRPGTPSRARRYPLDAWFMPWLLNGQTWVCHDVDTDLVLPDAQRAAYHRNAIRAAIVVPLLLQGQLLATLMVNQTTPRAWTGQEVALVEETLERTRAAVERARAEEALAASEAKYRVLFDSIDEGFTTVEVLFDEVGKAVDYRFLELNQAHEKLTGLPRSVAGMRVRELVPDVEETLLQRLERVARTGEPMRYEQYMPELERWFEVYTSRVGGAGSRTLANVFTDITARRRREQNLAFLATLSVDFAPLLSAGQIMARLSEQLGDYLHLSRCYLAEVDATAETLEVTFDWQRLPGQLPPLRGPYRLADCLTAAGRQHFAAGHPLVLNGREPSPLLSISPNILVGIGRGSSVGIPLLINGQCRFLLTVARAEPGDWRPDEVKLLQQLSVLIHTRLARAQTETALQEAHDQLAGVLEHTHDAFYGLDADLRFTYVNQRAAQLWGRDRTGLLGQVYWQLFPQAVGTEMFCRHQQVLRTREAAHFETLSPILGIWIEVSIYPGQQGGLSVFFRDIDARRHAEERQQFLLQLNDVLHPLTDPVAIQQAALRVVAEQLGLDRALYNEIDPEVTTYTVRASYVREGFTAYGGVQPMGPFTESVRALQQGVTKVVWDVETDDSFSPEEKVICAGIQVRAFVVVPLLKNGRWVLNLVAHSSQPRSWLPHELLLLEETADRTWAAVERARAEEARHASEQRLRAVMENLPGGAVFVVDAGLRYQVAEGAALREMGLLASDFVGRTVTEMAPPPLVPDYQRLYAQALTGRPFEYEHEQGGRTFATRGGPLRTANGSVEAVLAVSYDITARKQAEAAVLASEEKYRTLFDSIDEGYCIIEMLYDAGGQPHDWRFVEVNPAFEKNNGLAQATGKTIRELVPAIEPKWVATYGRVARTGQPLRFEEDSDALGRCFSLYAFPVGGPGSPLVAVLFTDITARRQAEEALRLSEARLLLALEAGHMGSFEWSSVGNRITLSTISEEVLGLLPDTPVATSDAFFRLVHPDDRARHQKVFEQAGGTGEDFHSRYRVVRPHDGAVRWIEERGQGTHEPVTSSICLRGVHWDVTETMLAQQQLAEFNTRLEQRVARRTRDLQASRDLLQSVFDTNLVAMSALEAVRDEAGAIQDFRLRLVNRELERATGRTDLVGTLYAQEYPGIREAGIFNLAVRALETGEPQGMEYHYTHEGFDKWFSCQFVKLGDGVVATNLDITERKTAEQERLRNLRLLEQAEAVAGLGSWDYELATGTLRWSDGMYLLFNLPMGAPVVPADYLARVVDEDRSRAEQLVRRLSTGAGDFEETLRLRVDTQVKTVRLKAVVLHDAAGQPVRVLGVDLDLSELQRLEADNLHLRLRQQRALFEAVQAAQETERKRMAEALHNGIGQMLYATKLRLDRLHAPLLSTTPAVAAARQEADQLLGEAIRQTRALSHELVPTVLTEFGLATALKDICRNMSGPQLRMQCQVTLDEAAAPLGPALQMALYRMAQELAQNIIKHAHGATQASLELETMPGWVLLRAEDNGPGFTRDSTTGLGLRSIRDRVALLEGQFEAGSVGSGGAYVRIRIPVPVARTP